jgi:hypothetical protein
MCKLAGGICIPVGLVLFLDGDEFSSRVGSGFLAHFECHELRDFGDLFAGEPCVRHERFRLQKEEKKKTSAIVIGSEIDV